MYKSLQKVEHKFNFVKTTIIYILVCEIDSTVYTKTGIVYIQIWTKEEWCILVQNGLLSLPNTFSFLHLFTDNSNYDWLMKSSSVNGIPMIAPESIKRCLDEFVCTILSRADSMEKWIMYTRMPIDFIYPRVGNVKYNRTVIHKFPCSF